MSDYWFVKSECEPNAGMFGHLGLYLLAEVIQFLHFKTREIKLLTFYYKKNYLTRRNHWTYYIKRAINTNPLMPDSAYILLQTI